MINLSPSGLKSEYWIRYWSNNLYQISSKDIKNRCLNIKIKFVLFIYSPWEKKYLNVLEYVVIFLVFQVLCKWDSEGIKLAK